MQCIKTRWAKAIDTLESNGCVVVELEKKTKADQVNGCRSVRLLVPGVDKVCLFPPLSYGAAIQRMFWSQIELSIDESGKKIESRWIYWSVASLFQHCLISGMILIGMLGRADLSAIALMFALGNLIPLALAHLEVQRALQRIAPTLA